MEQQQFRSMMRLAAAKQKISTSNLSTGKQAPVIAAGAEVRNLSGKEKVQLLKLLKDKAKNEGAISVTNQGEKRKNPSISLPLITTTLDNLHSTVEVSESFFDTSLKSIAPHKEPKSDVVNAPILATSIPTGFFDDPIQDLTARGLTMKQQLALQDEIEKKELNSLIAEIGEINEDTSAIDAELESAFKDRDYDEAAIQMAYTTILATLYKQSDSVISSSIGEIESNDKFDSALFAADTESKLLLNSSSSSNSSRDDPLRELVNQKLTEQQSKKRKLVVEHVEDQQNSEDSEEEEESYDPLEFI